MHEIIIRSIKEHAIKLGFEVCELSHSMGSIESLLNSSAVSDEAKLKIAAIQVPEYRKQVQQLVEKINENYNGVEAAETSKRIIEHSLSEFEKVALPYLR